ncbi:MAG: hypothetical protein RL226_2119 [Bacteroidota bacterium]|jgi:glucose/arabinose dehydrogenase
MKNAVYFLILIITSASLPVLGQPTRLKADRMAYVDDALQVLSFSNNPAEDRLFIVSHNGKILVFEDGAVLDEPFLDLGPDGLDIIDYGIGSEEGLNGMVLDPNYDENGFFYLMYNGWKPDGTGVNVYDEHLICFRRDPSNPYKALTDEWSVLITFDMPRRGHNGGAMFFDTEGHLYLSVGDGGATGTGAPGGGSGGDIDNNAQNLNTLLGKILRIDVNGFEPYTVPSDNPFVGVPDTREEIWAYGFRNPWRWSFDRATGDKYIGDVGEVDWEEVSFEPANSTGGLNYGWRRMEGTHCYEPVVDCNPDNDLVLPVLDYPHANGLCSVVGGFVYRGASIPSLYGYYILADYCGFEDVQYMLLRETASGWESSAVDIEVEGGFIPFQEWRFGWGEDNAGEVYLCTSIAFYRLSSDPDAPVLGKPEQLVFSPNPTNSLTYANLGTNASIEWVEVFDASGRIVQNPWITNAGFSQFSIDFSSYPAGIYTVHVKCNGVEEIVSGRIAVVKAD